MTAAPIPPTPPLLIGLTAPAGSGKGTAARLLEEHYAFTAFALADPLLDMACVLASHVDVDGAWCVERELKEQPMPGLAVSYRQIAQGLGDWGRGVHREFWVEIAHHKLRQARTRGENVCVTDIRYPNEAAWLRAQGGVLVAIVRDGVPPVRHHSSEQFYDELAPEHVWTNNQTCAYLLDQIDQTIAELRTPTRGTAR